MQARALSITGDSIKAIADHASRMEELSANGIGSSVASVDKQCRRNKGAKSVSVATANISPYWETQCKQGAEKAGSVYQTLRHLHWKSKI